MVSTAVRVRFYVCSRDDKLQNTKTTNSKFTEKIFYIDYKEIDKVKMTEIETEQMTKIDIRQMTENDIEQMKKIDIEQMSLR